MSLAQLLLRHLLELHGGGGKPGFLLVIDGEGLENLPEQVPAGQFLYGVFRVGTELGLRHLLWRAKGAPLIAVLSQDAAKRVLSAPDILRRAINQRVHSLSVNDVLEVFLGVRVIGADAPHLQQLSMEHLEQLGGWMSRRTLPTVVDRKLLIELLLNISVGEQMRAMSPAQLLSAWVRETPRWSENVRKLLSDALPVMHGDEGRVLAWALQEPEPRLKAVCVHGAVLSVDLQELPPVVWGILYTEAREAPLNMNHQVLRRTVARLSEEALGILGDDAISLLNEANKVAREHLTPKQLETSRILPLAFLDRANSLVEQAVSGQAIGAADMAWLSSHRAARMFAPDLAVLKEIARLSRWLSGSEESAEDVFSQVVNYQREGAFADLAILRLRRALSSSVRYTQQARKVLEMALARRERENLRFAQTLSRGYDACLHSDGLTPLHRLWRRVVVPMWDKEPDARLFLVVLDGCSYPVFLELLYALSQDATVALGLRPDGEGRVMGMPALAPLPTVTSHARGAIFLGELPLDPLVLEADVQEVEEARTDKARFGQNQTLGKRSRRLFLKGDLGDGGQALLSALEDMSLDVAAVVFNAVDDQIGSANTGAAVRLLPGDIGAFVPALRAALRVGRKVVVTADHGHSPFVEKGLRAGAGKAPRYLGLGKDVPVPEGFMEIDVGGLGGPKERRAFAYKPGVYLGMPQVGFHGGCGLEEMVVPLAWIERDGLAADEPAFWYGRGALGERAAVSLRARGVVVDAKAEMPLPLGEMNERKAVAQLSLFEPSDKAVALPLPQELLEQLSKEEKTVLVLLRENGSARASELAKKIEKKPGRFNGMMVRLRMRLHEAGVVLFSREVLESGEFMYRYLGKGKP